MDDAAQPSGDLADVEHLGDEDAAWLRMEDASNPMIVNGLLQLEQHLDDPALQNLAAQLARSGRFRCRVIESTTLKPPSLAPIHGFDVRDQIERVELPPGDGALRAFIDDIVSTLLDRSRPLWRVYAIDRPGAGTALFVRVHHALADGFALLAVLLSICDGEAAVRGSVARAAPAVLPSGIKGTARELARLVTLPTDSHTALKAKLGGSKRVAWSAPLSLAAIKKVARSASGTVNDVLVAVVTGALRRYLARRGSNVDEIEIHAMVPVNFRPRSEEATLGNRFGIAVLGLPLGVLDPLARIGAVGDRMRALKNSPEALLTYTILRAMGRAPRTVEDLGVAFFERKASLVLTNVPGPTVRLHIAGIPISRIVFWVPQSGHLGLGISILSYAGEVTVGIVGDVHVLADPDELTQDLASELTSLEGITEIPLAT